MNIYFYSNTNHPMNQCVYCQQIIVEESLKSHLATPACRFFQAPDIRRVVSKVFQGTIQDETTPQGHSARGTALFTNTSLSKLVYSYLNRTPPKSDICVFVLYCVPSVLQFILPIEYTSCRASYDNTNLFKGASPSLLRELSHKLSNEAEMDNAQRWAANGEEVDFEDDNFDDALACSSTDQTQTPLYKASALFNGSLIWRKQLVQLEEDDWYSIRSSYLMFKETSHPILGERMTLANYRFESAEFIQRMVRESIELEHDSLWEMWNHELNMGPRNYAYSDIDSRSLGTDTDTDTDTESDLDTEDLDLDSVEWEPYSRL